jgi:5-methylcytosine-specific restriction endonuclease McrA
VRFPKPEPRAKVKARHDRQLEAARRRCVEVVFRRERGRCQRCGFVVRFDVHPVDPRRAHVNETIPRSRGGDPTNPDHCELLCVECHMPNGRHAPTAERLQKILRGF